MPNFQDIILIRIGTYRKILKSARTFNYFLLPSCLVMVKNFIRIRITCCNLTFKERTLMNPLAEADLGILQHPRWNAW